MSLKDRSKREIMDAYRVLEAQNALNANTIRTLTNYARAIAELSLDWKSGEEGGRLLRIYEVTRMAFDAAAQPVPATDAKDTDARTQEVDR